MKYLILLALTVAGCGSKGGNVTTSPGPLPNQTNYTMNASLAEPGDTSSPATVQFTYATTVQVPASATPLSDMNETQRVTLFIGAVQCYYIKTALGTTLAFNTCTGGFNAGDSVTLPANTAITYFMQSGYCTQDCSSQITVLVTH